MKFVVQDFSVATRPDPATTDTLRDALWRLAMFRPEILNTILARLDPAIIDGAIARRKAREEEARPTQYRSEHSPVWVACPIGIAREPAQAERKQVGICTCYRPSPARAHARGTDRAGRTVPAPPIVGCPRNMPSV